MKKIIVSGLLITGVMLSSGCAGKFSHGNFEDKMFSKYDTDEDGYVNKKEHLEIALNRFDRADDNEDAKVTKKEIEDNRFAKIFPNLIKNYFKTNDLNSDGVITKAELISNSKVEFIKSDKNKDNKLSKEEMKEYKIDSRFESIDENKDGLISKEEYKKQKMPFSI